jgi:hypothetical protein
MAKNIKLRDLLNEDDVPIMKRVAGYKSSIDNYLTKTGPNKDGEYELDPRLAGIEKAIGQDATKVVKPSALKKNPLARTREEMLADIADIIYNSKGYIYDDEQEAYDQITSIKNLEDWEFVEEYFQKRYGKTLASYLVSNNYFGGLSPGDSDPGGDAAITKKLANWIYRQSWMPQTKKDEYLDLIYGRGSADIEQHVDVTHGMFGPKGFAMAVNMNDVLDLVSLSLDVLPFIGWVASSVVDLINASVFAFKGDFYNAGMRVAFAAIPTVSGGGAIKLSQKALMKLGDLAAKVTEKGAAVAVKLLPAELAAVKFFSKSQVEIVTKIMGEFVKQLKNSNIAKKAVEKFQNLTIANQKEFLKSLISFGSKTSNSYVGKTIIDFITQTQVISATDKALRLATKPSAAEADAMFKKAAKDIADYFKINASTKAPAAYVRFENVATDLKLSSILKNTNTIKLLEEKEWSYDEALQQANEDRAAAIAEESIVGTSDIVLWGTLALSGLAVYASYKSGKGLLTSILGFSAKDGWGALWKNGFSFKKWREMLGTDKGLKALEKYGITLTKTELENMTRACVVRSQGEIDKILYLVRMGELSPKEAIKMLRNLTPDTLEKEYLALLDIWKTGIPKGTSATQAGAAASTGAQSMTRAQWASQYPNVTPEQFEKLNLTDRYYLQNVNPLAKYNYRTQSIIRT